MPGILVRWHLLSGVACEAAPFAGCGLRGGTFCLVWPARRHLLPGVACEMTPFAGCAWPARRHLLSGVACKVAPFVWCCLWGGTFCLVWPARRHLLSGVACETRPTVCQHTQHCSKTSSREGQVGESAKMWKQSASNTAICEQLIKFPDGDNVS